MLLQYFPSGPVPMGMPTPGIRKPESLEDRHVLARHAEIYPTVSFFTRVFFTYFFSLFTVAIFRRFDGFRVGTGSGAGYDPDARLVRGARTQARLRPARQSDGARAEGSGQGRRRRSGDRPGGCPGCRPDPAGPADAQGRDAGGTAGQRTALERRQGRSASRFVLATAYLSAAGARC